MEYLAKYTILMFLSSQIQFKGVFLRGNFTKNQWNQFYYFFFHIFDNIGFQSFQIFSDSSSGPVCVASELEFIPGLGDWNFNETSGWIESFEVRQKL